MFDPQKYQQAVNIIYFKLTHTDLYVLKMYQTNVDMDLHQILLIFTNEVSVDSE